MNTVCKNFGAALVVAILLLATGCGTKNETPQNTKWGDLQDDSYAKLQQQFENPDMIYAPYLFWFWDEPLNREKIVSMADEMLEQRFNLGYIHGRISMYELLHNTPGLGDAMEPHPSLPGDEWMSDEWLATVGQLADMTGERGAYVGYNDEYMWPSGQAKGRVVDGHPELCNEYLTFSVRDVEPGEKVALPESFFTVAARLQDGADCVKYRYTHIEDNIAPAGLQAYDIKGAESLGQTLRVNEPWLNELSVMTTFYFTRTHTGFTVEVRENGPRGRLITSKYFPGGRYEDDKPTLPIPEVLPAGTVIYVGLIPDDTSIDGDMAWWYKSGNLYKDGCAYIDGKSANDIDFHLKLFYKKAQAGDNPYYEAYIKSSSIRMISDDGAPVEWTAPQDGAYRIYSFTKNKGQSVNYLDKRGAERFIELAHKPYVDKLGIEKLQAVMPGCICDNEGGYGSLPWSIQLPGYYHEKTGNDIRLTMPIVIDRDIEGKFAKARYDYFDVISDLYTDFFGTTNDYLQQMGIYYVSNFWEESLQWVTRCVGDLMKMQRRFSLPGTDALTMKIYDPHDLMESHSVAAFENRRLELEFMGAGGWGDMTPKNLKCGINAVVAWGANHIVPHGTFLCRNLRGNVWTPDYYNELPMWKYMHLWTDFIRRASYIASNGNVAPDVLVLNPLSSAWVLWGNSKDLWGGQGGNVTVLNNLFAPEVREINHTYSDALRTLAFNRIEYLVADKYYMERMNVDEDVLSYNDFRFKAVIVPPMAVMSVTTARKLLQFAENGGNVYSLGYLPSGSVENGMNDTAMVDMMTRLKTQKNFKQLPGRLDEELKLPGTRLKSHIRFVSGEFDMLQKHRIIDNRHFFWVANNGDETQIPELEIQGIHGKVTKWDCETGKIEDVPSLTIGMNERIRIAFQPNEAFWIVVDPSQPSDGHLEEYCDEAVLQTIAGIWNITIPETVQPVLETPVEYPDSILPKPLSDWNRWSELPSGFSGLLDYSTHLVIDAPVDSAIIDLGTVYHFAQVWVNGKDCGAKLWAPYKFSTDNLKQGENHIVIRVGNLVNNNYDMEYERKLLGRYLPPETFRSGLMGPVRILSEQ